MMIYKHDSCRYIYQNIIYCPFQDDKLPYVHFTGAFLVFVLGGIYCYLDTVITYKMASTYNSVYIGHVRLVISLIGTAGLLLSILSHNMEISCRFLNNKSCMQFLHPRSKESHR